MNCVEKLGTCEVHGALWPCTTKNVLQDVGLERERQFAQYGTNHQVADGTGPETRWLLPVSTHSAVTLEKKFRRDYEDYEEETGCPTWVHLVREEVSEAFQENDSVRLEKELLQVAALAVSWVEKIRERREWGITSGDGDIIPDRDWHSAADAMKSAHGFGTVGPFAVWYRDPGKDWREWGTP